LDFDAVRAAENAIRAPTELRFGSPPPPHVGDDATAQMARRFDRARAVSEAEREELMAEADRRFDELERQAEEANRRALAEAERRGRAAGRRTVVHASLVDAAETATAPAGDDGDAAGQWAQVSARFDELERQAEILAEAQRRDQATGQSDIEENARRWLETAGDDAAARASAFAAGGYLDPSDFTAAPDSPPTPPPIPRPPPGVIADARDAVQAMYDHPGGVQAAMAEIVAGFPPDLPPDSSSDSESTEASSDSDSSDSSEPLFGAVTAPRVEADL